YNSSNFLVSSPQRMESRSICQMDRNMRTFLITHRDKTGSINTLLDTES
ncbi:2859_t:CDS:1, partial [Funneliformis mosseae]